MIFQAISQKRLFQDTEKALCDNYYHFHVRPNDLECLACLRVVIAVNCINIAA
jgi:hypothetical protein